MSLMCVEKKQAIEFGEPLYALQMPGSGPVTAVCQQVIDHIPRPRRLMKPLTEGGGVNVYEGRSSRNFTGAYTWSDFCRGEFLFAVDAATARSAFPRYTSGVR